MNKYKMNNISAWALVVSAIIMFIVLFLSWTYYID